MVVSGGNQGNFGTAEEISLVFHKALDLVKDRDGLYADRWKEETLLELQSNIDRKYHGCKNMVCNGHKFEQVGEHLLDLINYTAFVYRKMELEARYKEEV